MNRPVAHEVSVKMPVRLTRLAEDVLGCKWSLTVLRLVREGVTRPGAMERAVDGLTAKVLQERLKKLVDHGVLVRTAYPEIPPRVEYALSPLGERFTAVLDALRALDHEA